MRCKNGDMISIFDGKSGEWDAVLDIKSKDSVRIRPLIKQKSQIDEEKLDLWLLFCLIKKSRADLVIEKATELGVSNIFPIMSSRSQFKEFNISRARSISIEAAEQCGRLTIPNIEELNTLENILNDWPKGRWLTWGNTDNETCDVNFLRNSSAILVGPEGGFSQKDKSILNSHEMCKSIKFGNKILRSETAVISLLSLWRYINK